MSTLIVVLRARAAQAPGYKHEYMHMQLRVCVVVAAGQLSRGYVSGPWWLRLLCGCSGCEELVHGGFSMIEK
jgi:hypothetical protein